MNFVCTPRPNVRGGLSEALPDERAPPGIDVTIGRTDFLDSSSLSGGGNIISAYALQHILEEYTDKSPMHVLWTTDYPLPMKGP